ncbi:MAG: hypothetical protein EP343_06605 [Deltaproteobacteria bacterium]|nr:MAG: hypothetical protein EP343_06605 [Deltaproteobacteria bacterium]
MKLKPFLLTSMIGVVLLLSGCKKKAKQPTPSKTQTSSRRTPASTRPAPRKTITPKQKQAKALPSTGTIVRLEQGDLACYVIFKDTTGKEHNISGDFDLCSQKKKFTGKKVTLKYKKTRMRNCPEDMKCKPTYSLQDLVTDLVLKP